VENVRVGQMTNFDKVILDIETDGTIEIEDAVKQAATVLVDHFKIVSGETPPPPDATFGSDDEESPESKSEDAADVSREALAKRDVSREAPAKGDSSLVALAKGETETEE